MPGEKKGAASKGRAAKRSAAKQVKGARRRQNKSEARRNPQRAPYGIVQPQGISITVQIPPLRKPKPVPDGRPAGKKTSRRQPAAAPPRRVRFKVLIPGAAVALLLMFGGLQLSSPTDTAGPATTAAERTAPDFKPLQPADVQASKAKYDAKRNLVGYTTTFSGARLTVSQQALPPQFSKDPGALKQAADSIRASRKIETGRGPVYIAENDESNVQMAVFADTVVLLFVHSDRKLDEVSWKSFIELLKPS